MSARRAYAFLYARLVAPLDTDRRLEVDALLGDPVAIVERDARRREVVGMFDLEMA